MTHEFSYTTLYQPVHGAGYQVTVPFLPGLVTYGRTFDEARKMARDAIGCYLKALKEDHEKIPLAFEASRTFKGGIFAFVVICHKFLLRNQPAKKSR